MTPSKGAMEAAEQLEGEGRLTKFANEISRTMRIAEAARIVETYTRAGELAAMLEEICIEGEKTMKNFTNACIREATMTKARALLDSLKGDSDA